MLSYTVLALMLVIGNTAIATDLHHEALSGEHHHDTTLKGAGQDPGDHTHTSLHHCCHAHAHFVSIPAEIRFKGLKTTARDWTILSTIRPDNSGHAPPTPPPNRS